MKEQIIKILESYIIDNIGETSPKIDIDSIPTIADEILSLQLQQTIVSGSTNYHAKEIIKKLTSRPHLEDKDGFYDIVNDEIQMIKIVEDYLLKNFE